MRLDIHQRVFDWKQQRVLLQHLLFQQTQRRVVIQNVEAAAKCSQNEIVLATLNGNVAHLNRRQSALELNPFLSAVYRKKEAKLRADEKQVWIYVIFGNRPHRMVCGEIRFD